MGAAQRQSVYYYRRSGCAGPYHQPGASFPEIPVIAIWKACANLSCLFCRGKAEKKNYHFEFELFAEVVKEDSRWNTKGRNIILVLFKKDKEEEYWPRITKEKIKNQHIQVDWSKWVDEDEEDEKAPEDDFNPDAMNNFDMGEMEGSESDDEPELPSKSRLSSLD